MATLAFRPIVVVQEGSGIGVYKQAVAIKEGSVLYPTSTGYALCTAAQQGNDLVVSQSNMSATDTRKVAASLLDYNTIFEITLSGVSSSGNTAIGTKYALGIDATTGAYFLNSAVTSTPFAEIVEFVPNDINGVVGDTNVRVMARPVTLL